MGAPTKSQNIYGWGLRILAIIPFINDRDLIPFWLETFVTFTIKLLYAKYTKNTAPAIEIAPRIKSKSDNFSKIKMLNITIGILDSKGDIAIFIPSLLLCNNVSDITKVNKGPGIIPADNPITAPEIINVIDWYIAY